MKGFIEEYGKVLSYVLIATIILAFTTGPYSTELRGFIDKQISQINKPAPNSNEDFKTIAKPTINLDYIVEVFVGEDFDILNSPNVQAIDGNGVNISDNIQVFGNISGVDLKYQNWKTLGKIPITKEGVYTLRYSVRDANGFYCEKNIQILSHASQETIKNKYDFKIDYKVDGVSLNDMAKNYFTFDLYINDKKTTLNETGVYVDKLVYGTSYEIKNIVPKDGYKFTGSSQPIKGNVTTLTEPIVLNFEKEK